MKDFKKELNQLEKPLIEKNAQMIEQILESFGLKTRIAEINIEKDYTEYCLEITVGTDLEELEKHGRDIALAVASPTGKVTMVIPIPGRALVGIQIPKYSKEYLESVANNDDKSKYKTTWRDYIAFGFFAVGQLFMNIAKKILNEDEKTKNH